MALEMQAIGATFAPENILIPGLPAVGTTVLWSYLGTDLAHSQNLMPGAPAFTAVGTPTYAAGYASLTQANYLNTGLSDDNKTYTILFASRMAGSGTGRPMMLQDTATNNGISTSAGNTSMIGQVYGNALSVTLTLTAPTNFKLFGIAYNDSGTRMDIYNLTDNTTLGANGNGTSRTSATAAARLLLGANIFVPATIGTDMAFCAKINGAAWTQAQCQQAALNIRAVLATRGITV